MLVGIYINRLLKPIIAVQHDCGARGMGQDLNSVYKWASDNSMFFNAKKFHYLPLSSFQLQIKATSKLIPLWTSPRNLLMSLASVLLCLKTAHLKLILTFPVYLENAIT